MPKGRRTNNRHKRKRLPPNADLVSRGTQAGSLRDPSRDYDFSPLPSAEQRAAAMELEISANRFLGRIREAFRRRARKEVRS